MCGIAGQVTPDRRPVDRHTISAMGRRLRHRGPDDSGIYVEGHVGLAHQRLSVLDLSPAGHQPMSNDNRTIWIVFNGEIYNFKELRAMLRPRYTFRSSTDTEVILHLYEDQGLHCLSMLRGMFAFAIWDVPKQRLVLARDRLGKKPLYYSLNDGSLRFASELKALLPECQTPPIDPVALHHYLTFQYVPTPRTIFQGIQKLRPGHVLVYEDGKASESPYWSLTYRDKRKRRSDADYREEFISLLRECVQLRLVSDVPLGAFLSGGVDSSSIVAIMSQLMKQPVKTFSIGFKEKEYNELSYAREVARKVGTEHHEFVVEPSAMDVLPTLVRIYDEPYADSSAIPTYYVSQLSRQFVTVILTGDGGDELLGGYSRYCFNSLDSLSDRYLHSSFPKSLLRLLQGVSTVLSHDSHLRKGLVRLISPFSVTYLPRICYFSPAEKDQLYTPEFRRTVEAENSYDLLVEWFESAEASDLLDRLLSVDTQSYLPDDLLVKVDRATMAFGLEARCPFLDHRLVEFAASLPADLKVRNGQGKFLLKHTMRGMLPDNILDRGKMGFGVPIDKWFRGDCREFVRETLLSARCMGRGYFKPERIRRFIEWEQYGTSTYGSRVYALLMLELWHREYVDQACA